MSTPPTPPDDSDDDTPYINIREILGAIIGRTLVDVTQHDKDEFEETGESYVSLHFDNGTVVKFPIGEAGFDVLDWPDDKADKADNPEHPAP